MTVSEIRRVRESELVRELAGLRVQVLQIGDLYKAELAKTAKLTTMVKQQDHAITQLRCGHQCDMASCHRCKFAAEVQRAARKECGT